MEAGFRFFTNAYARVLLLGTAVSHCAHCAGIVIMNHFVLLCLERSLFLISFFSAVFPFLSFLQRWLVSTHHSTCFPTSQPTYSHLCRTDSIPPNLPHNVDRISCRSARCRVAMLPHSVHLGTLLSPGWHQSSHTTQHGALHPQHLEDRHHPDPQHEPPSSRPLIQPQQLTPPHRHRLRLFERREEPRFHR